MTVQELIDELEKVKDKSLVVRVRIGEGEYGTELVWGTEIETIPTTTPPYSEDFLVIG